MSQIQSFYGTGRRKRASARVFLKLSQATPNNATVNKIKLSDYFPQAEDQSAIYQPLSLLKLENKFDIYATVQGGGKSGQKDAIRHGLARAIVACEKAGTISASSLSSFKEGENVSLEEGENVDEEHQLSFRQRLKKRKLLTRDARRVERHKFGLHKSRKRAQFSKR